MGEARVGWRIAPLEHADQLQACVDIQRRVWGFGNPDLVSRVMLEASVSRGGTVLGAVADSQIVGFVLGFPAWWEGQRIEHSHMLAVLQSWRNHGVGRELKLAQGRLARDRGVRLVTWTFDPLEAKNAHLNLNRLGARVRRHYRDLYGEATTSELHSALGTDRFLAEWDVTRPLPAPEERTERGVPVLKAVDGGGGRLEIEERPRVDAGRIEVAVPPDIQSLKTLDVGLARRWRVATRTLFVEYLNKGYVIEGLAVERRETGALETAYVLTKRVNS